MLSLAIILVDDYCDDYLGEDYFKNVKQFVKLYILVSYKDC